MHFSVRVPEALGDKLKEIAEQDGRTKSYMIKKAIEKFVEDRQDYIKEIAILEKKNPS